MNEKSKAETSKNPASPWGSIKKWARRFSSNLDRLIPEAILSDPEKARRARLILNFGIVGSLFGLIYGTFYILIGHKWGALIILICSSCYFISPLVIHWKRTAEPAGQLLIFTLTAGFTSLCFVEGGLEGHAVAWLISVPLCAFILLGERQAIKWTFVAFFAASFVAGLNCCGVRFVPTFDPKWNSIVSSAGYLGLIIFLFILGMIFERGRTQAFAKMQMALMELAKSNERLIHLNHEKNEFLGIAAHDLRNPLTAIAGNVQLAEMTSDKARLKKLLQNISDTAGRMHKLVANLLDINSIEQECFTLNIEPCDLRQLIAESICNNQMAADKKMIEISFASSNGLFVDVDRTAFLQVMDNLISNALKYSFHKSTIQIDTLSEGSNVLVAVRDKGPGISESDQKKLFQKFTRLGARPTGGESSTGLGLAIVKKLVEAMSGTIKCVSNIGTGSTFTVSFPTSVKIPAPQSVVLPPLPEPLCERSNLSRNLNLPNYRN